MAEVALKNEPREARIIKISSKRQITIPAEMFRNQGFNEYAFVSQTDEGLSIRPIDVENEMVTVDLLRYLVEKGLEGEELISQYEALINEALDLDAKLQEAEDAIAAGKVGDFKKWHKEYREANGI